MVVPPQGHPQLSASERADPEPPEAPATDAAPTTDGDVLAVDAFVEDVTLVRVDHAGDGLDDLRVDRVVLEGVQLTGTSVQRSEWRDVRVVDGELSGVLLAKSEMLRVELVSSRGLGAVLASASLRHVRFVDCRLDAANFRTAELEHCVFERCGLAGADFAGATLSAVTFDGCDLTGCDFTDAACDRLFLARSTVDGLEGVAALQGAAVTSDVLVPLGLRALAGLRIVVDDEAQS